MKTGIKKCAALILGTVLVSLSGCGLTPRERTVLLPELSTENYGDLEQVQTLLWGTDVPVYSTGFRQENGKSYIYTAVTENSEIHIRRYDVQYGFYQDVFQLPTTNCFGIWISPDGTSVACLSDDSGYNLSLTVYSIPEDSSTLVAEYLFDISVGGVWSGDSSSFLGWSTQMPDGRHQAQSWYYRKRGKVVFPLSMDLTREPNLLLNGALSWDGGLGLIQGSYYESPKQEDTNNSFFLGNFHGLSSEAQLYYVNPGTEENDYAYRPSSFNENAHLYLQSCFWLEQLDPDIRRLAVNQDDTMAVTAESFGSGYMIYSYTISSNGTLSNRKSLYRGKGNIQELFFSSDGKFILSIEAISSENERSMESKEPDTKQQWQAIILKLSSADT